ncbi:3'-5' exonuclease [Streptomyces triticirhizae]|uniref:3'-5' exonuclease n=1 Tax=Streptomyces triticirhizae TaxID=2483353 RepID=A0A3M2LIM4_9ACTN|nr:3'-5' exonuclease [Streptomyces triticirhizae]RMI36383.1 3'-5' exonuclease [Streptomyces triticirhizae]
MNDFTTWPPLFVVDVEGNGANPPDLVEVAALPIRAGRPDTTTAGHWLIRPPRPVTPFAARVHGLTNEKLAAIPSWDAAAPAVRDLLGEAWICAHHAHVDYRVLSRHLPDWRPAGVIDTLRLARATYPDAPRHTLDALIAHTGIDLTHAPAQRHSATFDAYATAHLLITMAAHHDGWAALRDAAVPPGLPGERQPTEEAPGLW